MDVFENCHLINDYLYSGDEVQARNELIQLLDRIETDGLEYSPLINSLIRKVGLFPYLDESTSSWEERFVKEAFKYDVGEGEDITLHREQSRLLMRLLTGTNIAVSAPTSFGKSFVIDSFISIKKPTNVVIIVPTIALMDETRRRLSRKFGREYKIITASDQNLRNKNILIFPQERSITYSSQLAEIDILIVDEFYKASANFDKDRSPSLIRSIIAFSKIAKQRYYLAPNISELQDSVFTKDMEFLSLDFNTVFLNKHEIYREIGKDEQRKSESLLRVLSENPGKSLIYAGTYTNIQKVSNLLITKSSQKDRPLLNSFKNWLSENYDPNWSLTSLVERGVGVHNGQLHRSISQIQVRLFEEENGLDQMISTSSIIEGVNTSAKNVILWSNQSGRGRARINDFTYKNIIGRGGRMFRHFVGEIFILEEPPAEEQTQLDLQIPEELLGTVDQDTIDMEFTPEQVAKIAEYKAEMENLVGKDNLEYFLTTDAFQTSNSGVILGIARDIRDNPGSWNGIGYLNSQDANQWDRLIYKLILLLPGAWGTEYRKFIAFVKILNRNWDRPLPELLRDLNQYDIGIDDFFKLERNVTFKLSALLNDVAIIYNRLNQGNSVDLSTISSKMTHAFLPRVVYQLEEYGIPRMLARKINDSGVIDFENQELDINAAIDNFYQMSLEGMIKAVGNLSDFDKYILNYFYEGIEYPA